MTETYGRYVFSCQETVKLLSKVAIAINRQPTMHARPAFPKPLMTFSVSLKGHSNILLWIQVWISLITCQSQQLSTFLFVTPTPSAMSAQSPCLLFPFLLATYQTLSDVTTQYHGAIVSLVLWVRRLGEAQLCPQLRVTFRQWLEWGQIHFQTSQVVGRTHVLAAPFSHG